MITTVTITTVRAATPWHYALACPRQDASLRAGLNRLRESHLGCLRLPQPWVEQHRKQDLQAPRKDVELETRVQRDEERPFRVC